MTITLEQLAIVISGEILAGDREHLFSGKVTTDSREISPGSLFFALSGERFDGNHFAAQASQNGAAAVIVSRPAEHIAGGCAVILVKDTLSALQSLASWWRAQLPGLHVVAITGSNGKTSTKDFTKAVLSQKFKTIATSGNLNNHIGVPLSILEAGPEDEAAVWEMGMNHPGELAPLCELIRPEIGLITNIGSAHIEFMGSRDKIAQEKTTLGRHLSKNGTLAYSSSDDYADYILRNTTAKPLPVGGENDRIQALNIRQTPSGSKFTLAVKDLGNIEILLPVPGRHMVDNALLAAAAGYTLELSLQQIADGLSSAALTSGRLRQFSRNGVTILDDTYNANPDSMIAALDTLRSMELPPHGRRIAVLGKMGELGSYYQEGHERVGRHAASIGIDILAAVGEEAAPIASAAKKQTSAIQVFSPSKKEAPLLLSTLFHDGDVLLFKGSRSASIEDIMNILFPPEK